MSHRVSSILLFALVACATSGADLVDPIPPEGPDEFDPPTTVTTETTGTSTTGTTGTATTGTATTGTATTPSTTEVCYPGPLDDYSVCFPVVSASGRGADYAYPSPLSGSVQYAQPVMMIDLDVLDPNTEIAANFTLSEVGQSWKGQWAVVQPHAVASMQELRDSLGAIQVNSGYRSPAYNASVGGADFSRHMYGDAFDMAPLAAGLDALADLCYAHSAGFVSVYVSHVHCDWRDDAMNGVFYGTTAPFVYLPDPALRPVRSAVIVQQGDWLEAPSQGWDEDEPLRTWRAYDELGTLILEQDAAEMQWPAGASRVTVTVGLEFTLSIER